MMERACDAKRASERADNKKNAEIQRLVVFSNSARKLPANIALFSAGGFRFIANGSWLNGQL